MSKKIKDGWYIAAANGVDDVSCVAFYWDAEIRKHITDAMTMLERFNRVEGRFCTISVGLDLPEIFFLNVSTKECFKELFPKMRDEDFAEGVAGDSQYIDTDSVFYAGTEFDPDALKENAEVAVWVCREYEVDGNFISITALDGYSEARVYSCDIFQLFKDYEDAETHSQE
jgi:hypothetical protein